MHKGILNMKEHLRFCRNKEVRCFWLLGDKIKLGYNILAMNFIP